MEQELATARRAIHDLEHQLQCERSRLRSMNTDISRATQEKDDVFKRLRDTEQVSFYKGVIRENIQAYRSRAENGRSQGPDIATEDG